MNKLLCLFEIFFALFITGVAYCAKMPPGGIPEEKQQLQKKQNASKQTQTKKKESLTNQSKTIEINQNVIQGGIVAATGIGGMQLVQGLTEQDTDIKTNEQMAAYIKTIRCSYADGKSVKAGADPIELPGGNDETIKKLRDEYFALATDLKERKEALGLAPGIESEIIINKATTGLYSNENIGITDGVYSSIYRAQMGNESEQTKINEEKEISDEHVKGGIGAITTGVLTSVGTNIVKTENKNNQNTEKKDNQKQQTKQKEKTENNKTDNKTNPKKTQTKQKEKK